MEVYFFFWFSLVFFLFLFFLSFFCFLDVFVNVSSVFLVFVQKQKKTSTAGTPRGALGPVGVLGPNDP